MQKTIIQSFIFLGLFYVEVVAADSPHELSANVALVSDYLYRGISQTNEEPAIQGGFDYTHKSSGFYVGTWASNVDFAESSEIDVYAGVAGELANGMYWDLGGLYYIYPGSDAEPEENFFEGYAGTHYTFPTELEITANVGVAYSPDFFGEDGSAVYLSGGLDTVLPYEFGLSFALGWQDIQGDKTNPDGLDYIHYSIGLSKALSAASLDLTWHDANDDCGGDICKAIVFGISSSF